MHPADINAFPLPGDILLLQGRSKTSLINRGTQAVLRWGSARFTHVAVVLGNGLVADAMPDQGVTIRRWHDMEAGYDIAACRVARNAALANDQQAAARVLERITYYIHQPYYLTALVKRRVRDESGLVCSQFAAAVLKDVGFAPSQQHITVTLPLDIDRFTRRAPGWRQFPLVESTLYSGYRPAQDNADAIALPPLDSAQQTRADRLLADWDKAVDEKGFSAAIDAFIAELDTVLARSTALQDEFHDHLIQSIDTQYKASRLLKALDEASLNLLQLEEGDLDPASCKTLADEAGLEPWIDGATLLDAWLAAFPDSPPCQALFLHDEDQTERRTQRRAGFARTVEGLHRGTGGLRTQLDAFDETLQALPQLTYGGRDTVDFLVQVVGLLDVLIAQGAALFGAEPAAIVEQRLNDYPQLLTSRAQPWLKAQTDPVLARQATTTFMQLFEIDQERLLWTTLRQPHLAATRETLAPLLEAPTDHD